MDKETEANEFTVTQKWQTYNSKLVYVLSLQKGG